MIFERDFNGATDYIAENTALKAQLETLKTQLDKITAALQTAGIGVGN